MPSKYVKIKPGSRKNAAFLDHGERMALSFLKRLDAWIAKIDQSRINAHLPQILRAAGKRRGKEPLYSPAERAALDFTKTIERIRRTCRVCGNDRAKTPDMEGRCRVCRLRQKAKIKKKWRSTDHGRATRRAARSRHRARLRNAPINDLTAKGEAWVFKLYGHSCLKCGAQPAALDHVIPLAAGGPHTASNLQPLCWVCNSSKCARTCADYRPFPYYPEIQ